MLYNIFNKKKSISPLIATILLVVVAVALIAILLSWGKGFTTDSLDQTTQVYDKSDLTGYVWFKSNQGKNLFIENRHDSRNIKIIGYKINSNKDYLKLNKTIYLDKNITLKNNSLNKLKIGCIPSKEFKLDLLTENNTFIPININTTDFKNNYYLDCSLILREDFKSYQSFLDNNHFTVTGDNVGDLFVDGKLLSGNKYPRFVLNKFFEKDSNFTFRFKSRVLDINPRSTSYFMDFRDFSPVSIYFRNNSISAGGGFNNIIYYINSENSNSLIGYENKWSDIVFVVTTKYDTKDGKLGRYYAGTINGEIDFDLLEVYNRRLTEKEINLLYNS